MDSIYLPTANPAVKIVITDATAAKISIVIIAKALLSRYSLFRVSMINGGSSPSGEG